MMNAKYDVPVVLKHIRDDAAIFKPLPQPRGQYPYRLDIQKIIGDKVNDLQSEMTFHMIGDTGSARHSDFQATVANALSNQVDYPAEDQPAFMYHLGDVVYNHGEAHAYPAQFLKPYANYRAPIFAIPGNHDGEINPLTSTPYESLDAFCAVFCDSDSKSVDFGGDSSRMSMIQPNVYFTLITPLARFIGLYGNVNKHGMISDDQRQWFVDELREAALHAEEQAIIVCIHHAPYSADNNHGSSQAMIDFLETSFAVSGVYPDLVCSGHVHNYQRFSKRYDDDTVVPYIVAGAGGYADLHAVASVDDPTVNPQSDDNTTRLQAYCDNRFGFLKINLQKDASNIQIALEYYTLSKKDDDKPALYDKFTFSPNRSFVGHSEVDSK